MGYKKAIDLLKELLKKGLEDPDLKKLIEEEIKKFDKRTTFIRI